MTTIQKVRRQLTSVSTVCVIAFGVAAAPAGASYGELSHFGEAGTGKGQFNLTESFGATDALGVDPTTNALYVVDGPTKKEFRIQKWELQAGKWAAVAERKFKPAFPRVSGVEGVAVDPAHGRIYVLALGERGEAAKVDPEIVAAGSLYAFSTSTLEPASGTAEGVLAGSEVLNTLSNTAGDALLEPSGIAVDPTTGDVIVLAYEDSTGADEELRVVLQRISSTGTLGARWSDATNFFGGGGDVTPEPTSPVVTATGKIYVADGELPFGANMVEEIDEVPSNFAAKGTPTPLTEFESEQLITFPGIPLPVSGGGLALGPDGTFYAYAQLLRQEGAGFHEPAVLAFSSAGAELGWFGGQNQPKESAHVPCAISFRGHPLVAAGASGTVFVFDSDPASPDVVEFGPGGSGCPTASATAPVATVNNEPVSGPVSVGTKVKFTSKLTQANALSVEWEFVNTATKASEKIAGPANEFQTPELTHSFSAEGAYAVKETIVSDDLASPPLVKETTITAKAAAPTAQFSVTTPITLGEAARFDAKTSSGNGASITSYVWNFGDGTAEAASAEAAISHTYAAPGTYTATLTVKSAIGTGEVKHQVEVLAPSSGGGTGGGGNGGSGAGGGGSGSSGGGGSSGGTLAYRASLAGGVLSVSRGGTVLVKIQCQGQSSCTGTVTLRTLSAVAAKHKAILTLGSGTFAAAGGSVKQVTLHLSTKALSLLARLHLLKVRATIVARDSAGASHTSSAVITLRAPRRGKH